MSNPLVDFIDLADKYGTQVSRFGVDFSGSLSTLIWRAPTELIVMFVQLLLTYSIWIVDLIINKGLFLEVAGSVYQSLLDTIYQYVNPLYIAVIAAMILFARMYIGDKVLTTEKNGGRISGFELNNSTLGGDEAFRKKITSEVMNSAVLLFIIIIAMANPFTLLVKVFSGITWFVGSLAPQSTGASPQVDGFLAPMLQVINFQEVLAPACGESWSATLAGGGNVSKLSCLTASEKAATTADHVTLGLAIVSILMAAGFIYFSWIILMRFSWMLCTMIVNVAVVPWQAAMLMANPGNERKKLNAVKDRFLEAAKSLAWLIITVVVASAVPAALITAVSSTNMPAVITMLISSALFFLAGKFANKYIGRRFKRDKDGNRIEITDSGATGWNDFRQNGGMGKWLAEPFNEAQKASKAELAMSEAIINGTSETHSQSTTQKGSTVDQPVVDPVLDEAVKTVDLTTKQPAVILDSVAGKMLTSTAPIGIDTVTEVQPAAGPMSSAEFAAAATSALIAEANGHAETQIPGAKADAFTDPTSLTGGGDIGAGAVAGMAAATAAGAAATGASGYPGSAGDDSGGRHHRNDGETPIGAAEAVAAAVALDPEAERRQTIANYLDAIEQISVDPDAVEDTSITTTITTRDVDTTAFHRVAKVYSDTAEPGEVDPISDGVVGRSGEFLSTVSNDVEWQEYKTLAKSMGMDIEPPPNESTEDRLNITFYSSTEDGKNEVRYRGRGGFGDAI
ncbi:hypothetical protein PXH69_21395 [Rhodococcus qingshengii]|uniref:Uncharacterized protein n=1 Tax=Rhodococcus qingshengii TaxID=334542 RepID=A0AAW6LQR1_RHOSG|nr:hypothetical protein [Rhodococcus qingshengii]MDE8647532.1 hypothetical protein [Rhodococcus qingshengii]